MIHVVTVKVQIRDNPNECNTILVGAFEDPTEHDLIQIMGEAGQHFAGKRCRFTCTKFQPGKIELVMV